jgi:hypothetical protein
VTLEKKKWRFVVGIKRKNPIFLIENEVFRMGGTGFEPVTSCL